MGPLAEHQRVLREHCPLQSSFSAGCQPRWGEAGLSPLISVDQLEKVSSPVDCEGR